MQTRRASAACWGVGLLRAVYLLAVPRPERGWTAFFLEMRYPGGKYPWVATTEVVVAPDEYP